MKEVCNIWSRGHLIELNIQLPVGDSIPKSCSVLIISAHVNVQTFQREQEIARMRPLPAGCWSRGSIIKWASQWLSSL